MEQESPVGPAVSKDLKRICPSCGSEVATPEAKARFARWKKMRLVLLIFGMTNFMGAQVFWFLSGTGMINMFFGVALGILVSVSLLAFPKNT
jgi:hypothetical protein